MRTNSWLNGIADRILEAGASELLVLRNRVTTAMERSDLMEHGIPYCQVLEPLLLEGDIYDRNLVLTNVVMKGLRIATEALYGDSKLRRALGIPAYMDEFLDLDARDRRMPLVGRFDAFVNEHGRLSGFIEYNGMPGGLISQSELNRLFGDEVAQEALGDRARVRRTKDSLDSLWEALHEDAKERGLTGSLRIGVPSELPGLGPTGAPLHYLAGRGATVFVGARELFAFDGTTLTISGEAVDYVRLDNEVDWVSLLNNDPSMQAIGAALKAGVVSDMAGLSGPAFASFKCVFELLSNPQYRHLFDEETITVLEELIPWTRVLKNRETTHNGRPVDLLTFVREQREQLIIKPNAGAQGNGVVLGWRTDAAAWERAIAKSRMRTYVVQERVPAPPKRSFWMFSERGIQKTELSFDTNIFVWNGATAEHLLLRGVTSDGIPDVSTSNATTIPYLVIDPPIGE